MIETEKSGMSQCEPEGDMSVWSLCQGETGKIEHGVRLQTHLSFNWQNTKKKKPNKKTP